MTNLHAMQTNDFLQNNSVSSSEIHEKFVQRVESHIAVMNQAAQELVEELALPHEAKFDLLAAMEMSLSPRFPTERDFEEIAYKAYETYAEASYIDEILRQNENYILDLAREKVPPHIASPEVIDLEIQELAQRARIKLWKTLLKRQITHIKAYIRRIVHSESIDMVRSYKPALPVLVDEDGELSQGDVLLESSEGMQDPLYELEQKETVEECIMQAVDLLCSFPHCQQQVMVCSLNEQVDDARILTKAFRKFEINIVGWPREKKERIRLKASLSAAHKRMRSLKRTHEFRELIE